MIYRKQQGYEYYEEDDIRTEVFQDGSWAVFRMKRPYRSITSGELPRSELTSDIEQAKIQALKARQILKP